MSPLSLWERVRVRAIRFAPPPPLQITGQTGDETYEIFLRIRDITPRILARS